MTLSVSYSWHVVRIIRSAMKRLTKKPWKSCTTRFQETVPAQRSLVNCESSVVCRYTSQARTRIRDALGYLVVLSVYNLSDSGFYLTDLHSTKIKLRRPRFFFVLFVYLFVSTKDKL